MHRGEIRLVDLDPVRGSEADKRRPAVIVSNDSANATATRLGRGVLTVVPVTSNVSRVLPFQVLLLSGAVGLRVLGAFTSARCRPSPPQPVTGRAATATVRRKVMSASR